jgi:hypothetical protein
MLFFEPQNCRDDELLTIRLGLIVNLTDEEQEIYVDRTMKVLQKIGFPFFSKDEFDVNVEFDNLKNFDIKLIELPNNELQQIMLGLNLANFYHPHMFSVKCGKMRTPYEVFNDKSLLKKCIRKMIRLQGDSALTKSVLRRGLTMYSGTQKVSNFRPTIAKYIYDTYAPVNSTVLDPCMGYGGRLIAALASKNVHIYEGCDPCQETFDGNLQMCNDVNHNKIVRTQQIPFEDSKLNDNYYDFIFTSPPYFNLEKYSEEDDQSWKRYSTYEVWRDQFLKVLIQKSYNSLKKGHYFLLNVDGDDICHDSEDIAINKIGFKLENVLNMRLSRLCGKGIDKTITKYKFEPIYVFKK